MACVALPRKGAHGRAVLRKQADVVSSAAEPAPGSAPSCRVCWGEEECIPGGELLQPCSCRGTLTHIHARCLREWAVCQQQTGRRGAGLRCEICKAAYSLPGEQQQQRAAAAAGGGRGAPPWAWGWLLETLLAVRETPAGRAYVLGAALCGVVGCLRGMLASMGHVPTLFWEARHTPTALWALGRQLAVGSVAAPLTGLGPVFYTQAALFYAAGFLLDAASCRLAGALQVLQAPWGLGRALAAPLRLPQLVGMGMQAFHLALLSFLGGATDGFVRGVCSWVRLPLPLLRRALAACSMGARWVHSRAQRRA